MTLIHINIITDTDIELFLKKNPVEFDNGYVRHSYHRACAMIGRLINNKSYIPFVVNSFLQNAVWYRFP